MAIFNKDSVVDYIICKHQEDRGFEISPLKLQKTLYFLYAMWAGNANGMNEALGSDGSSEGVSEIDKSYVVDLFEPKFEAWKFGPVDRDVYFEYRDKSRQFDCDKNLICITECENIHDVKSFVDTIISQTFELSDFTLVDMSHQDEAWRNIYSQDPGGTTTIPKEKIIYEYTEKLFA